MYKFSIPLFLIIAMVGCKKEFSVENMESLCQYQLTEANRELTEVIMKDLFTPPVSSRIYAYSNIAAYEALRHTDSSYLSLAHQLNGLLAPPEPNPDLEYAFPIASQVAFVKVASRMVYTNELLEAYLVRYLNPFEKKGLNKKVMDNSISFGEEIARHILAWMEEDGYKETRGKRHSVSYQPGKWKPTPPDFMDGIEPFWSQIRPFVLDSASQFPAPSPPEFDTIPGSEFYEQSMEVYLAGKALDEEKEAIARFWDCNPNITFVRGHVKYFKQQLSPGGHWVSIACIASAQKNLSNLEHAVALTMTSIALADAFISCWDTKYKTDLIRPETYIERYIDPDWTPFLQTPAFPEYTSGHSVISNAAAEALTHLFGDEFAYSDTSEVSFGLPAREFLSFREASKEAAISRLHGGIHYKSAITNGIAQGVSVGQLVAERIKFKKNETVAFN
jgi:hypothetical protein